MAFSTSKKWGLVVILLLLTAILHFSSVTSYRIEIFYLLRTSSRATTFPQIASSQNSEIAALREQVAQLSWQFLILQEKIASLTTFREKFSLERIPAIIPANVIARRDSAVHRYSFVVDRGSKDGVMAGNPVVFGHSLIGRVWEVGPLTSRVVAIVDPTMRIGSIVILNINGKEVQYGEAMCIGKEDHCELRFLEKNYQEWNSAYVITSGFEGDYPVGLVIGKVVSPNNATEPQGGRKSEKTGLFWNLQVEPVNIAQIHTVLILPNR
jgi:rod shape-determining protein MreC